MNLKLARNGYVFWLVSKYSYATFVSRCQAAQLQGAQAPLDQLTRTAMLCLLFHCNDWLATLMPALAG
jgi:hypothetical protein